MSGIMEHILARRSIRRFTDAPVSRDDIQRLLEAAMAAPSASNRRPWAFVVVTDPKVLARLRGGLVFGQYRAPLSIIVCGDMARAWPGPGRDFWIQDCAAATENILLAATGLGLGAVWIGVHPIAPLRWHVARVLGLPRRLRPLAVVHIGHPAEAKPPRTQYDDGAVHWNRYGGKAAPAGTMAPTEDCWRPDAPLIPAHSLCMRGARPPCRAPWPTARAG